VIPISESSGAVMSDYFLCRREHKPGVGQSPLDGGLALSRPRASATIAAVVLLRFIVLTHGAARIQASPEQWLNSANFRLIFGKSNGLPQTSMRK
jgi:hypothetical protein